MLKQYHVTSSLYVTSVLLKKKVVSYRPGNMVPPDMPMKFNAETPWHFAQLRYPQAG